MKLGFIGTGTITEAIIHGLMRSSLNVESIIVSPRNRDIASRLEKKYLQVHVGADNQAVIDGSDKVFICLRSQITEDTLKGLRFRPDQTIISLVAMATQQQIYDWTGQAAPVYRAVPLPFIEKRQGKTPIYPDNEFLRFFFDALGGSIALKAEKELAIFLLAGSMMGVYFRFIGGCNNWLTSLGVDEKQATAYLSAMFGSLSDVMREVASPNFLELEKAYSTAGGTNEMLANIFEQEGGIAALTTACHQVLKRVVD